MLNKFAPESGLLIVCPHDITKGSPSPGSGTVLRFEINVFFLKIKTVLKEWINM